MGIYIFLFFLLGVVLGSFYNVVGFRLPKEEDLVFSRSHCMSCNHVLSWYELIPIISFLIQRGRCRHCHAKVSLFYPVIELCCGLLFAVSFYSFGFSYDLIIALTLVSVLMIILVSDLNYLIIPDSILVIASIIIVIVKFFEGGLLSGIYSIGSGILLFGIMYLIMILGNLAFKKETLGGGDVKLMFLSGLVLHPIVAIFSIFLASIIALPISLVLLYTNKEHVIPFGPFIAIAILILFYMKIDINQIFSLL